MYSVSKKAHRLLAIQESRNEEQCCKIAKSILFSNSLNLIQKMKQNKTLAGQDMRVLRETVKGMKTLHQQDWRSGFFKVPLRPTLPWWQTSYPAQITWLTPPSTTSSSVPQVVAWLSPLIPMHMSNKWLHIPKVWLWFYLQVSVLGKKLLK